MLTSTSASPPRWSAHLLRACLPNDSMRDGIVGDLHEELVRDTQRIGEDAARMRYRQRVAGIVLYVILDTARLRAWGSTPIAVPAAAVSLAPAVSASAAPPLVGRGDVGLIAGAFGVLGLGIVVNTLLFTSVRHAPSTVSSGSLTNSALGVAALLLALGCATVAALMLCVGPRWLRRRACREAMERRAATARGTATSAAESATPS